MRKKILTLSLLIMTGIIVLTGCNKKEEQNLTNAQKLSAEFKEEIQKNKNIEKVAEKLSKSELIEVAVESFKVEDQYLSGFSKEIKGFKKAYGIRPFIGSIPFISYIFETDDPNELSKNLKENADLRWNICTEADYLEIEIVDNYVFFVMMPKEF